MDGTNSPTGAIFRYGMSKSSLNNSVTGSITGSTNGSFNAALSNLSANSDYYFQGVLTFEDGSESVGEIVHLRTGVTNPIGYRGYMSGYEIPYFSVVSGGHGSGNETFGTTKWHTYSSSNSTSQKVVTHTFAHNNTTKRNYTLLYDKSKRCALWVAFAMNSGAFPWQVARKDDWEYDPALPTTWQPDLSSAYPEQKRSVLYSRGHQVASNDRRTTTEQTKQTTYFSNMTPQLDGFNGGVWSTLEGDIQKIGNATSGSDTLYVVTGPIFDSGYTTTVDKNDVVCAVPTRYFKCIMKVSFSGGTPVSATGAAYLLQHQNSGAERQNVTINEIEQITGFNFFANLPIALQNAAEAETHPTSYFPQKATSTSE